jgi:hypothetical protein
MQTKVLLMEEEVSRAEASEDSDVGESVGSGQGSIIGCSVGDKEILVGCSVGDKEEVVVPPRIDGGFVCGIVEGGYDGARVTTLVAAAGAKVGEGEGGYDGARVTTLVAAAGAKVGEGVADIILLGDVVVVVTGSSSRIVRSNVPTSSNPSAPATKTEYFVP